MSNKPLEIAPPTVVKVKRSPKKTTFVEAPKGEEPGTIEHARSLKELYEREAPVLERVVVRCNRQTKKWELYRNNEPYKQLDALVLINVSFSSEWDEKGYDGCSRSNSGAYTGYAAGDVLPVTTPLTVPTEGVVDLAFSPIDGRFYDIDNSVELKGAGYLILKENCSSEYVNSDAIGAT